MKKKSLFLHVLFLLLPVMASARNHPCLYTSSDVGAIREKVASVPWASSAFARIRSEVEPYADRHMSDPQWIVSRLAMYWADGAHYTQCYLKNQNWDRGEGNAPVPTLRMPGMRTWNKYVNVPLEDRIPYNETGDMLGVDKLDSSQHPVLIPYKESGHMVRSNNIEILTLAEKASFLYWVTGEEKFAAFSADIYQAWLLGTYYMNPILDPGRSTGSGGGWEPGGICGFYDYEQIHDDLAKHAAVVYDFLYDYLPSHPSADLVRTGLSLRDASETVFRKFIELGLVRGGRNGNWNVNGWDMLIRPILILDDDKDYPDGKGRQYYLHYLLEESTRYRACIPDILAGYNPVTGLWPESPGYGFGTVDMLTDWAMSLMQDGIDIIHGNSVLQKAAVAIFPWMDDRCNIVAFGDSRSGPANFTLFEKLYSYYKSVGDEDGMRRASSALHTGIRGGRYDRANSDWVGICSYAAEVTPYEGDFWGGSSYSADHRFISMKDPGSKFPMMFSLYGGTRGGHMTPNGLAACFYGYGYNLTPDSSAYESYWSADYAYHQSATGSNTIIPGYQDGKIEIVAMDPAVPDGSFLGSGQVHPHIQFASVTAGEKNRTVVQIRVSDESGFYVDFYSANLDSCDYLMHNVGDELSLYNADGSQLATAPACNLSPGYLQGYDYFKDVRSTSCPSVFYAQWCMPEDICSRLWMTGSKSRTLLTAAAPSSFVDTSLTPGKTSTNGKPTYTLIVRQDGENACLKPFMSVYDVFKGGNPGVRSVSGIQLREGSGLNIESSSGRRYIVVRPNFEEDGVLCIAAEENGKPVGLYLGEARKFSYGKLSINSADKVKAALWQEDGQWHCSVSGPATVKIGRKQFAVEKCNNIVLR